MFNGKNLPSQRHLSTFLHCRSDPFPSLHAPTSPSHTDVHHPEMFSSTWLLLCPYSPSLLSASSLTSGGKPSSCFLAHFWTGLGRSWELSPSQGGSWHQDPFWSLKSCLKQHSLCKNSARRKAGLQLSADFTSSWLMILLQNQQNYLWAHLNQSAMWAACAWPLSLFLCLPWDPNGAGVQAATVASAGVFKAACLAGFSSAPFVPQTRRRTWSETTCENKELFNLYFWSQNRSAIQQGLSSPPRASNFKDLITAI